MPYISKSELAMRYFPESPVTVASKNLCREINLTQGLLEALVASGYKKSQKRFTPRQIALIGQYLGEP